MRSIYRKVDGEWMWQDLESSTAVPVAPVVHQDTLKAPLRDMSSVEGKVYESKSQYLRAVKKKGFEVVGNDLQSEKQHTPPEKITEAMVMDKIAKAEAIVSDPTKRRAYENERIERQEAINRALGKQWTISMTQWTGL